MKELSFINYVTDYLNIKLLGAIDDKLEFLKEFKGCNALYRSLNNNDSNTYDDDGHVMKKVDIFDLKNKQNEDKFKQFVQYDEMKKTYKVISNYGNDILKYNEFNKVQSLNMYPLVDEFQEQLLQLLVRIPVEIFEDCIGGLESMRMSYVEYNKLSDNIKKAMNIFSYTFFEYNLKDDDNSKTYCTDNVEILNTNKYTIKNIIYFSKISMIDHNFTLFRDVEKFVKEYDMVTDLEIIKNNDILFPDVLISSEKIKEIKFFNSKDHMVYVKNLLSEVKCPRELVRHIALSYKMFKENKENPQHVSYDANEEDHKNLVKNIIKSIRVPDYNYVYEKGGSNPYRSPIVCIFMIHLGLNIHSRMQQSVNYKQPNILSINKVALLYLNLLMPLINILQFEYNGDIGKNSTLINIEMLNGMTDVPIDLLTQSYESEILNNEMDLFEKETNRFKSDLHYIISKNGYIDLETYKNILPISTKIKLSQLINQNIPKAEELINGLKSLDTVLNDSELKLKLEEENPLIEIIKEMPRVKSISPSTITTISSRSQTDLQSNLGISQYHDTTLLKNLDNIIKSNIKIPKYVVNNYFTAYQNLIEYKVNMYEYALSLDIFIKLYKLIKQTSYGTIPIDKDLEWSTIKKLIEIFKVKMYTHFTNLKLYYKKEVDRMKNKINEALGSDTVREKFRFLERSEINTLHNPKLDLYKEDLELYLEYINKMALEDEARLKYNAYLKEYNDYMGKPSVIENGAPKTNYYDQQYIDGIKIIVNKYYTAYENTNGYEKIIKHPINKKNSTNPKDMSLYEVLCLPIIYCLYAYTYKEKENVDNPPSNFDIGDFLNYVTNYLKKNNITLPIQPTAKVNNVSQPTTKPQTSANTVTPNKSTSTNVNNVTSNLYDLADLGASTELIKEIDKLRIKLSNTKNNKEVSNNDVEEIARLFVRDFKEIDIKDSTTASANFFASIVQLEEKKLYNSIKYLIDSKKPYDSYSSVLEDLQANNYV
jgi:hypothetical protein